MKSCDENGCGCKVSLKKPAADNSHDHDHSNDDAHNHDHHQSEDPNQLKKDFAFIAISVVLALVAVFFAQSILLLQKGLFLLAIIISGFPIFWQGIKNIAKFDLEEQALLTIAVIAAVIIGEMPEAVIVTILFKVGEMLEGIAVSRSKRELEAVTKIMPENANLILEDSSILVVGSKTLVVGSKILIKSGEKVPVDAVILSGKSSMDSAALTGESAAREVFPGDRIMSGSINLGGAITCQTTSGFDDSTAGKIIAMVKDAAAKKGNVERFLSRFSRVYTPIVILAAIAVAVVPPLLGFGSFTMWISRALVFLVASCPCALVISIPLSFFAGIGGASKQGILIKGSKYIEVLAKAKTVVFDKTGTLTTGKLAVSDVYAIEGYSKERVLSLAATCEMMSTHPIAKAVVAAYGIPDTSKLEDSQEITSYGMKARIDGKDVLCGSGRLMELEGVSVENLPSANIYISVDGKAIGCVSVFDKPRADAKDSIAELKKLGILQTAMLTGDSEGAAIKVQQLTGLDRFDCDLLPEDKVEKLLQIKELFGTTLFVGDGINDAPVLAASDAGIAMGIGSDAAIEAADIILLSDKLSSLPQAIRIAKKTTNLAKFNIVFALGIKLIVLLLAFFGSAQMWMAVIADVGVSILCVLNATRALRFK